jgi:hypothetical protein
MRHKSFDDAIGVFSNCPPPAAIDAPRYVQNGIDVSRRSEDTGCEGILAAHACSEIRLWPAREVEAESASGIFLPLLHAMRTRKDWKRPNLQQDGAEVAPRTTTVEHMCHRRWSQPPPLAPITYSDCVVSFSKKHEALGLACGLRMRIADVRCSLGWSWKRRRTQSL